MADAEHDAIRGMIDGGIDTIASRAYARGYEAGIKAQPDRRQMAQLRAIVKELLVPNEILGPGAPPIVRRFDADRIERGDGVHEVTVARVGEFVPQQIEVTVAPRRSYQ